MILEERIKEVLKSFAHPCGYCPDGTKMQETARDCNECEAVHTAAIMSAIKEAGYKSPSEVGVMIDHEQDRTSDFWINKFKAGGFVQMKEGK